MIEPEEPFGDYGLRGGLPSEQRTHNIYHQRYKLHSMVKGHQLPITAHLGDSSLLWIGDSCGIDIRHRIGGTATGGRTKRFSRQTA